MGCFPSELSGERRNLPSLPLAVAPLNNNMGCMHFDQSYAGHALLIDRGTCKFCDKILKALASGADAVLIANSHAQLPYQMSWVCPGEYGDPVLHPDGIGIPACMLSLADAQALRAAPPGAARVGFGAFRAYDGELEQKPANDVTGLGVQQLLGGYNPLPAGQACLPPAPAAAAAAAAEQPRRPGAGR
jgi:hypothetical protein